MKQPRDVQKRYLLPEGITIVGGLNGTDRPTPTPKDIADYDEVIQDVLENYGGKWNYLTIMMIIMISIWLVLIILISIRLLFNIFDYNQITIKIINIIISNLVSVIHSITLFTDCICWDWKEYVRIRIMLNNRDTRDNWPTTLSFKQWLWYILSMMMPGQTTE